VELGLLVSKSGEMALKSRVALADAIMTMVMMKEEV